MDLDMTDQLRQKYGIPINVKNVQDLNLFRNLYNINIEIANSVADYKI